VNLELSVSGRKLINRTLVKAMHTVLIRLFQFCLLLVFLLPAALMAAEESDEGQGSLSGSIKVPADSAAAETIGKAAFFMVENGPPPIPGRRHRVPDNLVRISADGRFQKKLVPGKYYIGIILGRTSQMPGPPQPGESSFVVHGSDNTPQVFTVRPGELTEAGLLKGKILDKELNSAKEFFTVTGRITDMNDKPVVESIIVAFREGEKRLRPEVTLRNADPDGRYSLQLPVDVYTIVVRAAYGGGVPEEGEFVGRYGNEIALTVSGKAGAVLTGIDVAVFEVPEPGVSKEKFLKKTVMPFPEKAPRGAAAP